MGYSVSAQSCNEVQGTAMPPPSRIERLYNQKKMKMTGRQNARQTDYG